MWLFYLYRTVKIRLFYLVFPLAESMAKAFCWLFLWNFKEKASTIFYDTAFCICNGTILSYSIFFLALLKYLPLQSLPCLLNPCSQRSLSNCFWAVYTSGRRAEEGRGFLVNGRSGKGIAHFFVFITELSYPTVFFLFLALLKYPHFQNRPCLLNPCSQRSLSSCFGAVYTSRRRAEGGRGGIFSKWEAGQGHCPASFAFVTGASCISYFYSFIEIA